MNKENKTSGKQGNGNDFNEMDIEIELIGTDIDDILDAINFINNNYDVSVNPTDFQEGSDMPYAHKRNQNYSIFVKLNPNGDEKSHIRFINDLLDENGFSCRLYMI